MKQKDIALIIVVVAISGALSFFASRFLFATPQSHQMKAETVDPISTDFALPDKTYFNENSIDPTQQVIIGSGSNSTPFTGQ